MRSATTLSALSLAAALAGCGKHPPASAPPPAGPAAYPTAHPERRAVARWVEQPGAVFAYEETPLFAKVAGYVKLVADDPDKVARIAKNSAAKEWPDYDRKIDAGSWVKAGQVLAELDLPELADEARQKDALVRQAEQELEQARQAQLVAEADVAAAAAAVVEAKAAVKRSEADVKRWSSEARRIAGLVKGGVVDEQTKDETERQLASAEAAAEEVAARVTSADARFRKSNAQSAKAAADTRATEARVAVAKAEAARLASLLRYAKVTAPFDGVVTKRAVDPGHLVRPEQGGPLFVVARLDPVRVRVDVPEADAPLVAPGAEARLDIPALAAVNQPGKVARVSWALEPASRTLRAEIDLPNPERKLRPGMYVSAKLGVPQPETWTLPATAVVKQGDQTVCFVVRDGKAVRTPVQVGRSDGKVTEVPRKLGPGAGEWTGTEVVVAEHAAGLTDGQAIETAPAAR